MKITISPKGKNDAVKRKIKPTCIKIRIKGEKIAVEIIDIEEMVSKETELIKSVAIIAKAEDKNGDANLNIRFPYFLSGSIEDSTVAKTIIPSVAKAESQSEISNTAYGCINTMIETEIKRFVTESFDPQAKNRSADIISISPARITEIPKPVSAI